MKPQPALTALYTIQLSTDFCNLTSFPFTSKLPHSSHISLISLLTYAQLGLPQSIIVLTLPPPLHKTLLSWLSAPSQKQPPNVAHHINLFCFLHRTNYNWKLAKKRCTLPIRGVGTKNHSWYSRRAPFLPAPCLHNLKSACQLHSAYTCMHTQVTEGDCRQSQQTKTLRK